MMRRVGVSIMVGWVVTGGGRGSEGVKWGEGRDEAGGQYGWRGVTLLIKWDFLAKNSKKLKLKTRREASSGDEGAR